jgi:hypothetical protein
MTHKLNLGDPSEQYSFAELCRRNPAWMAGFGGDFAETDTGPDTIPTDHGALHDPRLDRKRDRDVATVTGLLWACGLTSAVLVVALVVAWLV